MSNSLSNSGTLSPKAAINVSRSSANNTSSDSSGFESHRTEKMFSISARNAGDDRHETDEKSEFHDTTCSLTAPSKIGHRRPPPCPPPANNTLRLQPTSESKIVSLKMPSNTLNASETQNLGLSSSGISRVPVRPRTPSTEPDRPPRKTNSKPPSPPPPRRSCEHRHYFSNQVDKPKINTKPISLVLRTNNTSLELDSAHSKDNDISSFNFTSSGDDTREFPSPNMLNIQALNIVEPNENPIKSLEYSHPHPNTSMKIESYSANGSSRNRTPSQTTGDQKRSSARSAAPTDSLKSLLTQKFPSRSKSVTNSVSGIAHLRVLSVSPPPDVLPLERERSLPVCRSSDRISVSFCTSTTMKSWGL